MWDQITDDILIAGLIVGGVLIPAAIAMVIALVEMKREQKDWF